MAGPGRPQWLNSGRVWSKHYAPIALDVEFTMDSANANGLGVSSIKGPGIQNVFAHTSQTPGTGQPNNYGQAMTNPNPIAGVLMIQLCANFNRYIEGGSQFITAPSGSDLAVTSGLTAGQPYVISVLGTTTTADWYALGLPYGAVPKVGAGFVAIATGAGSGSGKVNIPTATGSGVYRLSLISDPTLVAPIGVGATQGMWVNYQSFGATDSSTTTFKVVAIPDKTIVQVRMLLSGSSASPGQNFPYPANVIT